MEFYRSEETEEVGRSEEKKTEEKKKKGMSEEMAEENWMGRRAEEKQQIDKKTEKIIGICIKLHKKYGNSLTEKQYQSLVTDFLSQE